MLFLLELIKRIFLDLVKYSISNVYDANKLISNAQNYYSDLGYIFSGLHIWGHLTKLLEKYSACAT